MRDILNILKYSRQLRLYYIGIACFAIAVAVLNQVPSFLIKAVVDELTVDASSSTVLILIVIAYFATDFALTLATNIGGYLGDIMVIKLRRHLSERYYEHLLRLPQRYFDLSLIHI